MRFKLLIVLFVCVVFVACGRRSVDNDAYQYDTSIGDEIHHGYVNFETNQHGLVRTLSVLAQDVFESTIRQAEMDMLEAWAVMYPDSGYQFHLELNTYSIDGIHDVSNILVRLQVMLMAGYGYDMFFRGFHPIWSYTQSGFLVDIYTLIDQDPRTNREDFFTQPLKALEINDGLYTFPLSFGFKYVSINENLPQQFVNRFINKDIISIFELMSVYVELTNQYTDAFGHMRFVDGSFVFQTPTSMLLSCIGGFVDLGNRTANLTDRDFVSFLNDFASLFLLDPSIYTNIAGPVRSYGTTRDRSNEFVFLVDTHFLNPGIALAVDFPYFINSIPLSDNHGRLILDMHTAPFPSTWASVCFPVVGDSILAWEFTQHLIEAFSQPYGEALHSASRGSWGQYSMVSPISRHLLTPHITEAFETMGRHTRQLANLGIELDEESWLALIDSSIQRLYALNEMPMVPLHSHIPTLLFADDLDSFIQGAISAEIFAQRMQNAVSMWMLEQS